MESELDNLDSESHSLTRSTLLNDRNAVLRLLEEGVTEN